MIDPNAQQEANTRQQIKAAYRQESRLHMDKDEAAIQLITDNLRHQVHFQGQLADPLKARALLLSLYDVVASDHRYKPKDRAAYQAYQQHKKEHANANAWQAQQAYFDWLLRNDPDAFCVLDPIVSVHPDQVMFEVFSKDEASYACLSLDMHAFHTHSNKSEIQYGTTNINFSEALVQTLQMARSHRSTELRIDAGQIETQITEGGEVLASQLEKKIQLPDSWLRGLLQVQAAATLPKERFFIEPMDLYNLLRHLRLNADKKRQRRGLRVELAPNQPTRLVLEPWETVIESKGAQFQGKEGMVLRLWGRRRLMLLKRILPFIDSIEVQVLGSAMPSFWIMRGKGFSFTLGLTGFTAKDWAQSACFDLLLPNLNTQTNTDDLSQVLDQLQTHWVMSFEALHKATQLKKPALLAALQMGCQLGKIIYDLNLNCYRLRPILMDSIQPERVAYRDHQHCLAHDFLAKPDIVRIEKEQPIPEQGLEIIAHIHLDKQNFNERTVLLIDVDGYVKKAQCSCSHFRQHQLKSGPCAHLIATRIKQEKLAIERKQNPKLRKAITHETQALTRRKGEQILMVQISLDQKRLTISQGIAGGKLRPQRIQFNEVAQARNAYFEKINHFKDRGFLVNAG